MISCPRFGQPMGWFPGRLGRVTGLSIAHDGSGGHRREEGFCYAVCRAAAITVGPEFPAALAV